MLFDERGHPKYNVKLEKDKPVQILFDVLSHHESSAETTNEENISLPNHVHVDGENINKQDLICSFWNSQTLTWSSEGCDTIFEHDKIVDNIHPKGNIVLNPTV